jgi:hypothetical protein
VLSRYVVPEENLRKRDERDRVPYDLWARQGFIEPTSGNVVDYGAIEARIRQNSTLSGVKRRSLTTRGTPPTSRCASRKRGRP